MSLIATLLFFAFTLIALPVAAGPPNSEAFVFTESFEEGFKHWEVLDPKTWIIADNGQGKAAEITSRESTYKPPHRSPLHVALLKRPAVDSFSLTFKVKSLLDTGPHRDCCVFFGYQDPSHFYYAHLGARPDPNSGQIMIVDAAARRPLTENTQEIAWGDDWHTVKVIRSVSSGSIQVFFDDMKTPILETSDKTFLNGRIGIGSFDDRNRFDDIQLSCPSE